MQNEDLNRLRQKEANLTSEELKQRKLYLKQLQKGRLQGPTIGYASIDRPWLKYYRDDIVLADLPEMLMYDYLYECNKNNLDDIALNFNTKITYREMFKKIDEAEKMFINMGVKQGDAVSLGMPFIPETIYSIYALNKIGAIANMCDPRVPADKFKNYVNGVESKILITLDIVCPKVEKFIDDTSLEKVICMPATNSVPKGKVFIKNVIDRLKGEKKPVIPNDNRYVLWNDEIEKSKNVKIDKNNNYKKDAPAIIVYTSGTSGEPKGAILSNDAFNGISFAQPESIVNVERGDKFLLIMPPFIAYGLAIGMHGQLCTGQELVMVPNFNIDNSKKMMGDLVKKHKPQTIMGVPTFVRDLVEHPKMKKADLSFLKNFIVGGDSISKESEDLGNTFLKEHNSKASICKGWGMTEGNSCFTYTKNQSSNVLGSVGIPSFINNVRVLKNTTNEVIENIDDYEEATYNESGEIYIQTPTKMINYLNNPERDKEVFYNSTDGKTWIRSQDIASVNEDGVVFIEGRMKRIIVRPDGHNVSPFAIENIINKDERVKCCAVVGRPALEYNEGSWPVAYIELVEEYKNKGVEQEIINLLDLKLKEELPPRDIANFYEFIDKMPLTGIGKVDFRALQDAENSKRETKRI